MIKMTVLFLLFYMIVRVLLILLIVVLTYVLTELGYVLICQVREKKNAHVESESSTRNKKRISRRIVII